jgi:hypothetical protein
MDGFVHNRIKHLVEETRDAYSSFSGGVNADYAEFASLSLSAFKDILHNPDLTDRDLRRMIRGGMKTHKGKSPASCWATFMALYIAHNANAGLQGGHRSTLRDIYSARGHF